MSIIHFPWAALAVAATVALPAGTPPPPARDESEALAVIEKFRRKDPRLARMFSQSAGYVVFPTVAKAGFGVGGAMGKGYVYQNGRLIGRSTLKQLTIGLQAGGQAYSEVIFLEDEAALKNFKRGHLKLDAQASAVVLNERVSSDLPYRNGVAIVTMAEGGLMYEASVGGQELSFQPLTNGA
ncbi:MAG TPA: lipid-binding SYLF domain-containing protein [Gemmatimonadales bacterium]|nr:lipid-binding SYLF domain-containing protein [Gemmatimonadales bacterium]